MTMTDLDIESLKFDAEEARRLRSDLCDAVDKRFRLCETDKLVITCPWCGGSGSDGHDRSMPVSYYVCDVCKGSGRVELVPSPKDGK